MKGFVRVILACCKYKSSEETTGDASSLDQSKSSSGKCEFIRAESDEKAALREVQTQEPQRGFTDPVPQPSSEPAIEKRPTVVFQDAEETKKKKKKKHSKKHGDRKKKSKEKKEEAGLAGGEL